MPTKIPLEDNFSDILGKAQRGLGLSDDQLCRSAGITRADLKRVLAGQFDETLVRKLAGPLQLAAQPLLESGRQSWHPNVAEIDGLKQFNTPYADMTVNAYLAWDPSSQQAVAFDTGADSSPMLDFAKSNRLGIQLILLTHTHGDHIADLARLKSQTGANAWVCQLESIPGANTFTEGKTFAVGALSIETRLTSGHSRGGVTYVVTGLARPVAVVGDAMFAGSMGGGIVSWQQALRHNREKILSLPDDTILCCGHGPLSTVAEEKRHNPMFPEFHP
jgi:hydroxyacylglutathione hydrolase